MSVTAPVFPATDFTALTSAPASIPLSFALSADDIKPLAEVVAVAVLALAFQALFSVSLQNGYWRLVL
ncbi:MAG: hypothetical protein ACOX2Y_02965 [Christensenellales bacterium]